MRYHNDLSSVCSTDIVNPFVKLFFELSMVDELDVVLCNSLHLGAKNRKFSFNNRLINVQYKLEVIKP